MTCDIIATGSSGNCFLFNGTVLIDLGVPYSHLKDVDFSKITHILLTHKHGDHFSEATIRRVNSDHKHIKFIFGEWLKEPMRLLRVENFEVIEMNKAYDFGFKIAGVVAYHDVPNCGYRLIFDNHKHLHITDTSTIEGIIATNYDSATIECNYDTQTADEIIARAEADGAYTHMNRSKSTHLSVQETARFVKENGIKKLYPVHIGSSTKNAVLKYLEDEGL